MGLLPASARLVLRFEGVRAQGIAPSDQESVHPDLECPEKPVEYLARLRKERKLKSLEELGIAREPKAATK